MDMNLSQLRETVEDRGWHAAVRGVTRKSWTRLKRLNSNNQRRGFEL